MTMRGLLLTLLILNGLLLPLGCVPVLFVVNMVNPMQTAFVTDIHVTNRLSEPITVTPVGTIGPEGRRAPLPIYVSRFPAIPSGDSGGFVVGPGQTREILYDWDDINLSEIVVRPPDGTSRQLVVDPEPTKNQYRQPTTKQFVIDDLSTLVPVPESVAAATARAQQSNGLWLKVMPLLIPWFTFCWLLKAYRRRAPSGGTAVG
jgi:hypothetical protein